MDTKRLQQQQQRMTLFDAVFFSRFNASDYTLQELEPFLPVLMHKGLLGTEILQGFDLLEICFLQGLLDLSDKDLFRALVEAKQADEFDESKCEMSGILFERESSAFGQMRVCLEVLLHSSSSKCELLENPYFHFEVGMVVSVALRRLPEQHLPLSSIVSTFSRIRHGSDVLIYIAKNCPERFATITKCALNVNGALLNRLAELSPWSALHVRDALTEAQTLPDLALHLTLHSAKDALAYCSASLRMECSWIRSYFQANQEKENTPAARMRGFLLHALEEPEVQENPLAIAHILQLYSGVCGMWGLRLSAGSSTRIVNAIKIHAASVPEVALHGLCFLLVCEGLAKLLQPAPLAECIHTLYQSSVKALVALAAVRFFAKGGAGLALNAAWAKTAAGVPVSIHSESFQQMGAAWRDAVPEPMLASSALSMPIVVGLHANMSNYEDAAVLVMKEMISGHMFTRAKVDPSSWVASQVLNVALPIHSSIPELISDYVGCCVNPGTYAPNMIAPAQVEQMQKASFAVRVAGAFLVLKHNALVRQLAGKSMAPPYAREIVEGFLLKRLLWEVQAHEPRRLDVLPSNLMSLCMSEHPEVMVEELWFATREEPLLASWLLQDGAQQKSLSFASVHVRLVQMARLSDEQLCGESRLKELFEEIFPVILSSESEHDGVLAFTLVWRRMHRMMPTEVAVATISAIRFNEHEAPVTSSALLQDPLIVLRMKPVVYEKFPAIFGLALEVLSVYASASRKRIVSAMQAAPEASADRDSLSRLCLVQDCAISQLVIEICAISVGRSETQELCCMFLHQLWIQHTNVLPLLHHQGYPPAAVSILVEYVPSMHVCIDFLPQLLVSLNKPKRVWGMLLASHLFKKYPTPKALEVSRLLMQRLVDEAKRLPVQTHDLLQAASTSIHGILKTFPVLLDEIIEISETLRAAGKDMDVWWNVFDLQ